MKLRVLLLLFVYVLLMGLAGAEERQFRATWSEVLDSRVTHYVLSWGDESEEYEDSERTEGLETRIVFTLTDLEDGDPLYFAVQACIAEGSASRCGGYSNEVFVEIVGEGNPDFFDEAPTGLFIAVMVPL